MRAAVVRSFGPPHEVLVTAVSIPAFSPALQMVRRKGTLENVNQVFEELKAGRVDGRMVLEMSAAAEDGARVRQRVARA